MIPKMKVFFFCVVFFLSKFCYSQTSGVFYGVSIGSGSDGCGMLYKFDSNSNQVTELWNFDTAIACSGGFVMRASNGLLYGASRALFSYDLSTNQPTYLHFFDTTATNYWYANGDLVEGDNQILYGLTSQGGIYNRGCLFSYDINSTQYNELHSFDSVAWSHSGLMKATDGMLYGFVSDSAYGKIFRFNPMNNQFDNVFDFDSTLGYGVGPFVEASNGLLYNITSGISSGYIYSFNRSTFQKTTLANFTSGSPLILGVNGKLYNTQDNGVCSFDILTNQITIEGTFNLCECKAEANLIESQNGKFYGVLTSLGGHDSPGEIFSYDPNSSQADSLFSFDNLNGYMPYFGRFWDGLIEVPVDSSKMLNDFKFYPNPTSGIFTVNWINNLFSVKVFDLMGKEIYSKLINNSEKYHSVEIDLSSKANGIYFIELSDGDKVSSKKIIVQK